jgi:hypothetical protein
LSPLVFRTRALTPSASSSSINFSNPLLAPLGFVPLTTGQIFNRLSSKEDPLRPPPEDAPYLASLQYKALTSLKNIWASSTWANRASLN